MAAVDAWDVLIGKTYPARLSLGVIAKQGYQGRSPLPS
jgi:hypothetical protein